MLTRWTVGVINAVFDRVFPAPGPVRIAGRTTLTDIGDEMSYGLERGAFEHSVNFSTGSRFWKCPACGKHGEINPKLDELEDRREHLVELEDKLDADGVVMGEPVDRDGLPRSD